MEQAGITIRKKVEFGNTEAVKKAVASGIGISIISEIAAKNEVTTGQIKKVYPSKGNLKRTFYFTYARRNTCYVYSFTGMDYAE